MVFLLFSYLENMSLSVYSTAAFGIFIFVQKILEWN